MKKKITIIIAAAIMLSTIQISTRANAGTEQTDIGCYEYGYSSADGYSVPNPIPDDLSAYGGGGRTYYVDKSGSDSNDGSAANPWKTIEYASRTVNERGSVIHINSGEYDVTTSVSLAVGVSLEGEAGTVVTSSTLTTERQSIIRLESGLATDGRKVDGNQYIANICFDGKGIAAQAIEISNRNYVSVHDCNIHDFALFGVCWHSSDMAGTDSYLSQGVMLDYYTVGGLFYNNTMHNNSYYGSDPWYNTWGRGSLFCGGLKDFIIYNNSIIEECTSQKVRGVPVKFWYYDGWMLGCKVYGNTIKRLGSSLPSGGPNGWGFAIESSRHSGMEIAGNVFVGATDLNNGYCGTFNGTTYEYATWIHDNSYYEQDTVEGFGEYAIVLEARTDKTIIERNKIDNYDRAVYFNTRIGISDVTFRYNLLTNLCSVSSAFRFDGLDADLSDDVPLYINNLSIYNNIIMGRSGAGFGIIIGQAVTGQWRGSNIMVANNLVSGFAWNWLDIGGACAGINGLTVCNNIYYGCGGNPYSSGVGDYDGHINTNVGITNLVDEGNFTLNSAQQANLFVDAANGNYRPGGNSAAIDAGISFGRQIDLDGNIVPFSSIQFMLGDVNGSGSVNSVDSTIILRYSVGLTEISEEYLANADVNHDGNINSIDAVMIARYVVGIIDSLE